MPYLAFNNFKYGKDSRKSELASVPGTLASIINAHINQGGEVEKRKAFVAGGNGAGALPAGCFGLEAGLSTLYTFGSIATPGGIPAGITYVRCQHPDGATAMSAFVFSTPFNGLPFSVVQFADGNIYPYYNGSLVTDFIAGLILAYQNTNAKVGTGFAALVNTLTGYTATDHLNATVDVFNTPGTQYKVTTTKVTAAGTVTANEVTANIPAVLANASIGQFPILSGTASPGVNQVSSVKVIGTVQPVTVSRSRAANVATVTFGANHTITNGDTINVSGFLVGQGFNLSGVVATVTGATTITFPCVGANVGTTADTGGIIVDISRSTEILNAAVDWQTSNEQTAANVAQQINAFASTPEFTAISTGSVVSIYTSVATPGSYNALEVRVGSKGNVCIGDCTFSFALSGGAPGNIITRPLQVNGIDILTSDVAWTTDLVTSVAAVASNINANSGTSGVLAFANGATLRLSKTTTSSADADATVTIPTPGAGISITTGTSIPLQATVNATVSAAKATSPTINDVVCTPLHGQPPYLHNWTLISLAVDPVTQAVSPVSLSIANKTTANPTFTLSEAIATPATATVVDVITDSAGNVVSSPQVSLIFV